MATAVSQNGELSNSDCNGFRPCSVTWSLIGPVIPDRFDCTQLDALVTPLMIGWPRFTPEGNCAAHT